MNKLNKTIKLFKAIIIKNNNTNNTIDTDMLKLTIPYGFVFAPSVTNNLSKEELNSAFGIISNQVLTGTQMNASFHKSWEKVKSASIEQLILEQILHYITTYGFERLGCFDEDNVFIPSEKLDIPELKLNDLQLTVIKGLTKEQIKAQLLLLLQSGIALREDTIEDVVDVAEVVELTAKDIDSIMNKEVKCIMFDKTNKLPESPVEFLRFIIYKTTGKTLIIKNMATIKALEGANEKELMKLFLVYGDLYDKNRLSEIFYRYKPLWLALRKTGDYMKIKVNAMRRRADTYHKPMKPDYLNTVTSKIKNSVKIDKAVLAKELDTVNTFRKIRLAYALKFRTTKPDSILYNVRNGKAFAKEFSFDNSITANNVLQQVVESIVEDIKVNVAGKTIYIPKNVEYALPYTEKQFTGNIPNGTCLTTENNMIFGVHWENIKSHRVDLDLSLISLKTGKIGWDSNYRTKDKKILFSGDVTNAPAPKGASELFYVQHQDENACVMVVNYFNFDEDKPCKCQIMVGQDTPDVFKENYMLDPNKVIGMSETTVDVKEKILGLIVTTNESNKFYFAESNMGNSISSSGKPYIEQTRKYLLNYYTNTINLNEILVKAGALLVSDRTECDIDLSLESVDKTTIIGLFKK